MSLNAKTAGHIYVIHAVGSNRIKVGYTSDVNARLSTLQTSSPFRLQILASWPGNRVKEREIHKLLSQYRKSGEWFEVPPLVVGYPIWQLAIKTESQLATKELRVKVDLTHLPVTHSRHGRTSHTVRFRDINSKRFIEFCAAKGICLQDFMELAGAAFLEHLESHKHQIDLTSLPAAQSRKGRTRHHIRLRNAASEQFTGFCETGKIALQDFLELAGVHFLRKEI